MLTRKEIVELYSERSGIEIDDWRFYEVYGYFRLAGIIQQIYKRYHDKETTNPRFKNFWLAVWFLHRRPSAIKVDALMAVIRLIRHGQASFGLKNYDQLSDLGVQQSRVLGESLRAPRGRGRPRDLRRDEAPPADCRGDARRRWASISTPRIDERWNEYDHQEVIVRHKPAYKSKTVMAADLARRGDPRHQFQLMFDDALARWTVGLHDDEYAEPWSEFVDRAEAGLSALADETAEAKNVLVFTSGGPMSAVAARLLGLDVGGWLKLNRVCANASETKIVGGRSGISLVTYNGHAHFDADRELLTYR